MATPILSLDNMNQNLKGMEFPWPSLVVAAGNHLEKEQKMVMSLCINPSLLDDENFPPDAKQRARIFLANCKGHSLGAYTASPGIDVVRKQVAKYIEKRDSKYCDYENIFLSNGATDGVRAVMNLVNHSTTGKLPGVMIPIPQYPLFSALVQEYGMYQIDYFLDEENDWAIDVKELRRAVRESRKHCDPRMLVVINPGNPSGFVLSKKDIKDIIRFAYEESLFILADEVYQFNVYEDGLHFYSFKKILIEMGPPYNELELASFMSASKGFMGECGSRGGFCEIINLDPGVKKMFWKYISSHLCSSTIGQAMTYCITNPPHPNEPSYDKFMKEKTAILQSLKERANYVTKTFNSIKGLECKKVVGAMYAFPRIFIPQKVIEKAKKLGIEPDELYGLELLETVGVCIIPGNQFGQRPGTYHFRMTFLPQIEDVKIILQRISKFQKIFMEKYQ
ncbi:alanine aminotransferase 2-like isoform X2 [Tachypleus tridentatus]|uniref:alanine aminotransferase 2-like isoform X2 n=1 Tax=Tachypleus tridentatus TaxID=6853 RepID=UPI003FD3B29E